MVSIEDISKQLVRVHDTIETRLNRRLWNTCITVGGIWGAYKGLIYLKNIIGFAITDYLPGVNYVERYGSGTWAVVTGASDGIGKAIALELGRKGFNIILIGRDKEKLLKVNTALGRIASKPLTKIIVADLSQAHTDNFFETLFQQIRGCDVGILVNNAATASFGDFTAIPEKDIKDMIVVNTVAPALITRYFINSFSERAKRCAIINVSSAGAEAPHAATSIYDGTNSFTNLFTEALNSRNTSNIDYLTYKPAFVKTKMIGNQRNFFTIHPACAARSVVRSLGRRSETFGHWKHRLIAPLYRENAWIRRFALKMAVGSAQPLEETETPRPVKADPKGHNFQ